MVIYLSIPLLSLYLGFLPLTLNNKLFREYVNGRWIETKEDGDVAVLFTVNNRRRIRRLFPYPSLWASLDINISSSLTSSSQT